ncbi:MAG: helix-turn-helix domain-containing protein [Rhodospirillales bacterium]|nr:helix-turn-helix domain-containing protein [Rhodospirillales bacterium]
MSARAAKPPRTGGGAQPGVVQSLTRAMSLLDALAAAERGLGLSEIAQRVKLPVSTVHRLLTTLQRFGYVHFESERGLWQVGVQAFVVGVSFLRSRDIAAIARPILARMMEASGETANLAVADQGEIIYLAQVESREMMRAMAKPGSRVAMYCSALGKAILAAWPEAEVRRLIERRGLARLTPNTITSGARLLDELAAIREKGYALDDEEHSIGLRCVAAAIFDEIGQPVAAVSLSAPKARLPNARLDPLGTIVRDGAAEITRAFGGLKAPPATITRRG